MRIELTPDAKDRLGALCKARGMTQVAVASRLVEWFALQPEAVQAGILGQYPQELRPAILKMILQHMSQTEGGGKKSRH